MSTADFCPLKFTRPEPATTLRRPSGNKRLEGYLFPVGKRSRLGQQAVRNLDCRFIWLAISADTYNPILLKVEIHCKALWSAVGWNLRVWALSQPKPLKSRWRPL